jgi:hypothetical protein
MINYNLYKRLRSVELYYQHKLIDINNKLSKCTMFSSLGYVIYLENQNHKYTKLMREVSIEIDYMEERNEI